MVLIVNALLLVRVARVSLGRVRMLSVVLRCEHRVGRAL